MSFYKTEYRKNNSFLRDYFGVLPLLGATITAGAVGGTAFLIDMVNGASRTTAQILGGMNALDAISSLYQHAGTLAGQYIMPAGVVGQFLTYKFKKSIASFFKK